MRAGARQAGIALWDKPAYACLATRVPTGQTLTGQLLARVEGAEDALFSMGFTDFRVRVLNTAARLQLPKNQWTAALERSDEIRGALAPYFETVLLDLVPRQEEKV